VNKQTVVAANPNPANNPSNHGSTSTFTYTDMKQANFDEEEDDDVFLNEKINALAQRSDQQAKSLNPSSESEINIDKKISSKSLNSINDRKLFVSNKTCSLPPSATSSEPSFPILYASSNSTKSNSGRLSKISNKLRNLQQK